MHCISVQTKKGGGHFVYHIHTGKRKSTCRVIGSNKKPIPMSNLVIDFINLHAGKEEKNPEGTVYQDMDGLTTVKNYNDDDSEPDEDDKSYETSDDSTMEGDHETINEQIQGEEDQEQYFNIPHIMEVNEDNLNEGVLNEEVEEVEEEESMPDAMQIEDVESDDKSETEEDTITDDVSKTGVSEEEDTSAGETENASEPEAAPMVRELESDLGAYWNDEVVGSVIQNYGNLEATLSTPQYGFQKGLNEFKETGYKATVNELNKNLIGKNVLDMLEPKSVTYDIMKMSLGYLMFLKRKR